MLLVYDSWIIHSLYIIQVSFEILQSLVLKKAYQLLPTTSADILFCKIDSGDIDLVYHQSDMI